MEDVHEVERSSELARVDAAEGELAVRVVEGTRRLERNADLVRIDQALRKRVVGDRRDAVGDRRDKRACAKSQPDNEITVVVGESHVPQVSATGPIL